MISVERIIDTYVEDYLNETDAPFTKQEVYQQVDLVPIFKKELVAGMVGLNFFKSDKLEEVIPIIRVVYLAPQHRTANSVKELVKDVMTELKSRGYKQVELQLNHKLNNWFKREMHSKPTRYTHLQEIDFFLDQLVPKGE